MFQINIDENNFVFSFVNTHTHKSDDLRTGSVPVRVVSPITTLTVEKERNRSGAGFGCLVPLQKYETYLDKIRGEVRRLGYGESVYKCTWCRLSTSTGRSRMSTNMATWALGTRCFDDEMFNSADSDCSKLSHCGKCLLKRY